MKSSLNTSCIVFIRIWLWLSAKPVSFVLFYSLILHQAPIHKRCVLQIKFKVTITSMSNYELKDGWTLDILISGKS